MIDGLKLRAWVQRIDGPPRFRDRYFFAPDRLGAPNGREASERYAGVAFGLSATGAF